MKSKVILRKKFYFFFVTQFLLFFTGLGQVAFNGTSYSQDFQSITATVLTPATISTTTMLEVSAQSGGGSVSGWFIYHQSSGTPRWGRTNGSSSTGSFFGMYDAQSTPNRAIGSQGSSSIVAFYGIVLKNTSGSTIDNISISYDAVMNRNPSTTSNSYPMSYRVSNTNVVTTSSTADGTFNDAAGTWTSGTGFTTPSSGTGAPGAQAAITPLFKIGSTITQNLSSLNWGNDQYLYIRWKETDESGSDATAGVDNFSISLASCTAPVTQASNILSSYTCSNSISLNWTNGDGSKRIVKMNTSNSFTNPTDGTDPTANSVYTSGEQVVYNGSGSSVTITGLNPSTNYYYRIYESNCSGTSIKFLTNASINNPINISTNTDDCILGDYRSITSGNWGINTSWEKYNGTTWVSCAIGDFPNNGTANVTIRNGHTIDNDGSGSGGPWDVKNLTIETGGKLWDNAFTVNGNSYIQVYGNIICNGEIGNLNGDDISFDIAGGANTIISGTGSFTAARIRKDSDINTSQNTSVTFNMDVKLTWSSASGTVLYNNASSNSEFNVTINSGKILRCSGPGSVACNVSIDGVDGAGSNERGGTYTINGTLDLDGILFCTTDNLSKTTSIIIENGGLIKCRYINASASGTGSNILRIKNGGKLNIFGSVDTVTATLNDITWSGFSNTNNTWDFQVGSTIEYSGATQQQINGITSCSNFIVSGGGLKKLGNDFTVNKMLTLTNGKIQTDSYKLIHASTLSTDLTHSSGSSSFINGNYRRYIATNTDSYKLPVGYSNNTTDYHPVNFLNGNLSGVSYLDVLVNSITETANNVDTRLTTTQEDALVTDVIAAAEWKINPNVSPTGGNYGVDLYVTNMGLSSADDDKFVVVKRDDLSADYGDWKTFHPNTYIPVSGTTGRIYDSGNGFARRTNYTSFSKFAIGKLNKIVLPISIYDFKVNSISKNKNLIEWKSYDEEKLMRYELEKSTDGFNYQLFNTTLPLEENNYSFKHYFVIDSSGYHPANFYKLFSLDYNGNRQYHDIAYINESKLDEDLSIIYTNDGVNIILNNDEIYSELSIYSALGQINTKLNIEEQNENKFQFNNSDFAPGIYFIQFSGKNKVVSTKIVLGNN